MQGSHPQYGTTLLDIKSHHVARDMAVAACPIAAGQCVLTTTALTTSLLPHEKGRRCDYCFRLAADGHKLSRCSGCGSFWYCDVHCMQCHRAIGHRRSFILMLIIGQRVQWKVHHKKLCKRYSRYSASTRFQVLSVEERVDAILLSQLLATLFPNNNFDLPEEVGDRLTSTFFDLLQKPDEELPIPPVCGFSSPPPPEVVQRVFSRFGNNNFVLHSHLNSYAHGVFPLASRFFNHSCVPNCLTRFIITPTKPVEMEVVAIRPINQGEEVCSMN